MVGIADGLPPGVGPFLYSGEMPPMRIHLLLGVSFLLALTGCGGRPQGPVGQVDDTQARLGTQIDLDLAKLLEADRADLAKQVDQLLDTAQAQRAVLNSKPAQAWLLPRQNAPRHGLLHQGTFSAKAGFSLPGYNADGNADAELALHYARHGDFEAGSKLAPADDAAVAAQLAQFRSEKNYPVEWARLVIAAQHLAELKLLDGHIDGATELVQIHKQLGTVLDEKARTGPLGALLLPTGKQALADAAAAWRKPGRLKTTLAAEIESAVEAWGDLPIPQPLLTPGASKDAVVAVLGSPAGARGVAATQEAAVNRALDLLALPVARDGVEGIVAFLDDKGQLAELQLAYGGKISQRYPEPRHFVWALVERGGEGKAPAAKTALPKASFRGGPLVVEVTVAPRSAALGAVVRIADEKADAAKAALPAEPLRFSPLRLDRTFDANRVALDRDQPLDAKGRLVVAKPAILPVIDQPVRDPRPDEAILVREKDHDLVRALHLRWKPRQNANLDAGARIAVPLWTAYGPSTIEEHEAGDSAALVLTWAQAGVQYSLRLPYSESEHLDFAAGPVDHSHDALKERDKAAPANDLKDRAERLAQRKPNERLDRSQVLPGLRLGQTKADVAKILPKNADWRQATFGDSVVLLHRTQPNPAAKPAPTAWLRQVVVRFDAEDKVAEIRGLYTEGPGKAEANNPGLLDRLKRANGEPEAVPSQWAKLWSDLPLVGSPAEGFRWRDDVTVLEVQRDSFGTEVTVKDAPADAPFGVELPALATQGDGPDGVTLGTAKADVLKKFPGAQNLADGGVVVPQPAESKFDAVIVYFDEDKATRVVGRLRARPNSAEGGVDAALAQFYAERPGLGFLRRRMTQANGQLLGGWGWHDDQTRIWAFGQQTPEGPQAFVEWRRWPVDPAATASR